MMYITSHQTRAEVSKGSRYTLYVYILYTLDDLPIGIAHIFEHNCYIQVKCVCVCFRILNRNEHKIFV